MGPSELLWRRLFDSGYCGEGKATERLTHFGLAFRNCNFRPFRSVSFFFIVFACFSGLRWHCAVGSSWWLAAATTVLSPPRDIAVCQRERSIMYRGGNAKVFT